MPHRVAVAVVVAGVAFGAAGLGAVRAASTHRQTVAPCAARVTLGAIPLWARSGFSGSTKMNYVVGRTGQIAGLLFAYPLRSPPQQGQDNKILWVSRHPDVSGANLHIRAARMIGTRQVGATVQRTVVRGPGPSIINLPKAGCWRFNLSWASSKDTLDLRYIAK